MPEIKCSVVEQAIDNLAGEGTSVILGNEVKQSKASKLSVLIQDLPARYGLPWELENCV